MVRSSNFNLWVIIFKIFLLNVGSVTGGDDHLEEKATRLQLFQEDVSFNKNHVGIIFTLRNQENLTSDDRNALHKNIVDNFKHVVVVLGDDSEKGIHIFYSELEFFKDAKQNLSVSVLVSPTMNLKMLTRTTLRPFDILDTPEYYHLNYETNIATWNAQINALKDVNLHYKLEYAFNMTNCSSLLSKSVPRVVENLRYIRAQSIVFYFEELELEEVTHLGANKMFEKRVVLMEQCQKLVQSWELDKNIKVSFIMLHYSTTPQFYENEWEMNNFIRYWKLLSSWASDANASVILNSAVDCSRYWKGQSFVEMGWWKRAYGTTGNDSVWISKIDDALLRFPELKSAPKPHPQLNLTTNANIYFMLIIMVSLIAVITLVLTTVYFIQKRGQKPILTKQEIDDFIFGGNFLSEFEPIEQTTYYKCPYEKTRFEIATDIVSFEEDAQLLGSGEFGKVCVGHIIGQNEEDSMPVAIKMLHHKNINKVAVNGLLSEIKVLSYIGNHEHIIQLVGANTENIKFGRVMVFLELCELGSLENHLHKLKLTLEGDGGSICTVEEQMSDMDDDRMNRYLQLMSMNKTPLDPSISEDLLRWSHEICVGMAYLASKNVVHAGLSTKNVLLNGEKEVKICDFGLSKRMDNYMSNLKKQHEPLHWQWMAPESLKFTEFSEKSDVWSYGVTIWEVFSLGDKPYPRLSWTGGFADLLDVGFRLGEPEYNDLNMYSVMRECWIAEAENRPSFAELLATFKADL